MVQVGSRQPVRVRSVRRQPGLQADVTLVYNHRMTTLKPRRKLTTAEMNSRGLRHRIHELSRVSESHLSYILSPKNLRGPSPGLAVQIASALTECLDREVTRDDLYEYLETELGKCLEYPRLSHRFFHA